MLNFLTFKAKDVELPPPEDGDILAIHDTGAYTMSMYCKWVYASLCLSGTFLNFVF